MEGGYPVSSGRRTSSFLRLELIPFCFLFSYFHLSVNLPGGELRRRGAEDELSMRKYLQVAGVDCNLPIVCLCVQSMDIPHGQVLDTSGITSVCLLTGRRLDLSRGAKHLPGRLIEHAHKKSEVWQAWSRLPSKVVSSLFLM